jgi:magnesium transporter
MKNLLALNDSRLEKRIFKMHPYDIANHLKNADEAALKRIIKLTSPAKLADIFIELPDGVAHEFFKLLNKDLQRKILNGFEMDELKYFILSYDEEDQEELISVLSMSKQKTLKMLMSYDEEKIASLMTTGFVTIDINKSIKEATAYVISNVKDTNYIDEIFVVDDNGLVGSVSLIDLISARPNDSLAKITQQIKNHLTLDDSINEGLRKFRDYGMSVLPILDDNEIVGIVTADDILTEMAEEHEDTLLRFHGVGDYDVSDSPRKKAFQRLPWLLVSVVLNLIVAATLTVFERTLTEIVALILFQPMILGMAGNIGTQSISVTILKINQAELKENKEVRRHIARELTIGVLNSIAIGLIGLLVSFLILFMLKVSDVNPFKLSLTVGVSLFGAMLISSFAGVFIPLTLVKLKVDPATASGPIITTLNDLFALMIYFGTATIMFML